MSIITAITATQIQDTRKKPTLRVRVEVGTSFGEFSVPSGASTGSHEAHELRDPDGGMSAAIANINETIAPKLVGLDASSQRSIDETLLVLDGTKDKTNLGGNTMIGVSCAIAKAASAASGVELFQHLRELADIPASRRVPQLYLNYINGGKHADSPISFQEHILVPQTDSVAEALAIAGEIDAKLKLAIEAKYGEETLKHMGDEGGYVLPEANYRAPFELLTDAIASAGLTGHVRLAIDAAATSFFNAGSYTVGGKALTPAELSELYLSLQEFNLLSIEDPFEEEAFGDFASLQAKTPSLVVGDDLTTTNAGQIERAVAGDSIKAVIIKPNQAGTLSEVLDAMSLARKNGVECIVSHRSGETTDTFIADLAFAFGAFGLKAGALRQEERRVKYERLRIISELR